MSEYEIETQIARDREIGWMYLCESCGDPIPTERTIELTDEGEILCALCEILN